MTHRIAIVGTACRYPDASTHEALWKNVLAQRKSFRRIPAERLRIDDYCDDPAVAPLLGNVHAALLADYRFDPARFGVRGRSFASADLSQWMALEVASEALADSGLLQQPDPPLTDTAVVVANTLLSEIGRSHVVGGYSKPIARILASAMRSHGICEEGVAEIASSASDAIRARCPVPNEESLAGGLANVIAGRISAHFGFRGGNCTVDGACAGSLIAVADGCRRLALGEAEAVVVGAVDISLDAFEIVGFALAGALARGPMRVYDERASGFWPGEGCGFVVLMREADALARGLRIHAVLRGWGHSSDGTPTVTRPEIEGQLLAITRAYRHADFGAESVDLFEGHGTGTEVGDAVEIEAIERVRSSAPNRAVLGSIKSNIGHTKAAAGMAGLLKTVSAVRDGVLPPSAHAAIPAPSLRDSSLKVLSRAARWESPGPRRAGVSSFGFGGTNMHVLVEEPPADMSRFVSAPGLPAPQVGYELFLFQGSSAAELMTVVERLPEIAGSLSFGELGDLATELARRLAGRGQVRAAIVASTPDELHAKLLTLQSWLAHSTGTRLDADRGMFFRCGAEPGRVTLMFPGQGTLPREGSEWPGRFAESWIDAGAGQSGADRTDTRFAQPAIVAAELSGMRLLRSLGVEADAAIGHSLGELTAMCWAGVIDEDALLRIAAARGSAMSGSCTEQGGMMSVELDSGGAESLAAESGLVVACLNGPTETVLSGPVARIQVGLRLAESRGIRAHRLRVSHAFHSPLMAPAQAAFSEFLSRERFESSGLPIFSTIAHKSGGSVADALVRQLTSPVQFHRVLSDMFQEIDPEIAIEVGPGRVLSGLASRIDDVPCVSMDVTGPALDSTLQAVGALFVLGRCAEPQALFKDRSGLAFDLEGWNPQFILNPFASIPPDGGEALPSSAEKGVERGAAVAEAPAGSSESPLELVVRLVTERLAKDAAPGEAVAAVRPDSALMTELKLTSREAAEVADRAAAALGVSGFRSTGVGLFTVAQLAEALRSKTQVAEADAGPKGIGSWVRALRVVEIETPERKGAAAAQAGSPNVIAIGGDALATAVSASLAGVDGTVVCLNAPPTQADLADLLRAAQEARGRFSVVQHGPWASALAKCLYLERGLHVCVVEIDSADKQGPARATAEIGAASGFVMCRYDAKGVRWEPRIELFESDEVGTAAYAPDSVVLVSGGAKGIGAECVLEIGIACGCGFVLLGRSRPDEPEVAQNLARFEDAGIRCVYVQADATSLDICESVRAAIEAQGFGPVTDIVHCSGSNAKALIAEETAEGLASAWAAKVTSAENLFQVFGGAGLRTFIGFGSIIGTVGFQGSGAYASANEGLRRRLDQWSRQADGTRFLCLEWSVWAGAGMGSKMNAIETMAQMGIEAIPVRKGARMLLDLASEMREGKTPPSLVVSARLPDLPTCAWRLPTAQPARFLENERVFRPGIELVCEPVLSAHTDPYLKDHALAGSGVFPAVMGMEAAVQVAQRVLGRTDIPEIRNTRFNTLIEAPLRGSLALRIAALAEGSTVQVAIRSTSTGFAFDHFTFECCFDSGAVADPVPLKAGPAQIDIAGELYQELLFHGPMFRAVHAYRFLDAYRCQATLEKTAGRWFGQAVPHRLALASPDLNDAAIHALQACIPDTRILPVGLRSFTVHSAAEPRTVAARQTGDDGGILTFDVSTYSAEGELCAVWRGLELKRIEPLAVRSWSPALAACVLRRRLDGFMTGIRLSIEPEGTDPDLRHTPNGKPKMGSLAVSRSHASGLMLTVTSGSHGDLACDMELVSPFKDVYFDDDQVCLIELLQQAGGDATGARTRVWCARECLSKAGYAQAPHLAVERADSTGVVLKAGEYQIFTTLIAIAGQEFCVAVASNRSESAAVAGEDRPPNSSVAVVGEWSACPEAKRRVSPSAASAPPRTARKRRGYA